MRRTFRTPARMTLAAIMITLLLPLATATAGDLDLEERVRYQKRIEQAYAKQRSETSASSAKSLPIDGMPSDAELRSIVENILRMASALAEHWGHRIDGIELQAEYERILEHSNDRARLGQLLEALDHDPDAIVACLVEPMLVRRELHRAYWWDSEIHAELRRRAEHELLTDDGSGGLDFSTSERSETEWRLMAVGEAPGVEYENGVQIRKLNREQWDRLARDLGQRWRLTADSGHALPILQFSALEETKEYLSASVILEQSPTHVRLATCTWWKTTFSEWWEQHAPEFSARISDRKQSITLQQVDQPAVPVTETKDDLSIMNTWISMDSSDPEKPSARDQHTAVWSGAEMIIWGGTNGSQIFSSGGLYDPATDDWTSTSQSGDCPAARIGHSAAWSDERSKMFLWGGWDEATNFDTGARYNPATNSWAAIPIGSDTPSPRHGHAGLIVPGGEVLHVWGGVTATSRTQTGAEWDPTNWNWFTWPVEPDTPSARDKMVALPWTYKLNWGFFVWGGDSGSGYLNDGGMYYGDWNNVPSTGAPSARFGHTGVTTGPDPCGSISFPDIYVWGGFTPYDPNTYSNTGGVYALQSPPGSWEGSTPTGTNLPSGRSEHTAVMDQSRNWMVVWGGATSSGTTATGGILDVCAGKWAPTDVASFELPSARSYHTAVWTGKAMLVWGGADGPVLGDGGVYTHCWGVPTSVPIPRAADEDPCEPSGIRVSWGSGTDWNDYDVRRRVSILRGDTIIASDLLASNGSYLDTTAVEDQSYDYRIVFVNSCGESTTSTATAGVDEAGEAPTVSTAPTAVDADGCTASSGIDISWPANPDDWGDEEIGDRKYRVWRWRNDFEGWIALGSQIDYGTTSYHDASGGYAKYRVKYINGCGQTTDSPETAMVQDLAGEAPTVSQTAGATDADACVADGNFVSWPADPDDWGDGGTGDRLYRVRRSIDGVSFDPIGDNISFGTTSFVDTTASADQQYYYQVRYKNGCSLSADSAADTATDGQGSAPTLSTNSESVDTDTCVDGGITVTWPAAADDWGDDGGNRSYDVLRDGSSIRSGIAEGGTSFVDTTGDNGTGYLYQVRYNNSCSLSSTTTGDNGNDRPIAPAAAFANNSAADVSACAASGVQISWNADPDGPWGDSGGTHSYTVLREGTPIQTDIAYGNTTFTDTTGVLGTTYAYSVRYVNCGGLYSETAGASGADADETPPTPAAPAVSDLSSCDQDGVSIEWTPVAGGTSYDLRVDGTTEILDVTGPYIYVPGDSSEHSYEIRAKGTSCIGEWSETTALTDIMDPNAVFCDGFETGDTQRWSATTP